MKKDIQPEYNQTTITCACGNVLEVGSTKKDLKSRRMFKMSSILDRKSKTKKQQVEEQIDLRKNMVLHKKMESRKNYFLFFLFKYINIKEKLIY